MEFKKKALNSLGENFKSLKIKQYINYYLRDFDISLSKEEICLLDKLGIYFKYMT